jgi:branched-chain amino acid transport system permease protein
MDELISIILNGLAVGSLYALLALGLAIILSIMNLINLAHGEMIAVTGYTMYFLALTGMPFILVVLFGIIMATIGAVVLERIAFRPIRNASLTSGLITTFAVVMILDAGWTNFISPLRMPIKIPQWLIHYWPIGRSGISTYQGIAIALMIITIVALMIFLKRSIYGLAMRAAAEDFSITRLMGIRANRIIAVAFAVSGFLAGLAGFIYIAQRGQVDPHIGLHPTIMAFIAVVFGGAGSLAGAVAGGLILGTLEVSLRMFLTDSLMPYRQAIVYSVVILILFRWPDGLIQMFEDLRARKASKIGVTSLHSQK